MKITFTTSDSGAVLGVFLDRQPAGSPADFLAAHPDLAGDYAAAVEAMLTAREAQKFDVLCRQLTSAQAALDQMRAKYEPPPAPKNLLVVELPEPLRGADHVGITGYVKGHWHGDLLKATADQAFVLVEEDGLQFPAGEKVTSLSELTREQIEQDLARYHGGK